MRDGTIEEEARRQTEIRSSQMTLFSLQADRKRLEQKRSGVQAEIRRIRLEITHLKASLEEEEIALQSATREVELIDEAIVRAKKHINSL